MKILVHGLAVGLVALALSGGQAGAVDIASHKAIYDLSLGKTEGPSRFTGVDGLVTRSVERTCDGWIVAEHMVMRVQTRVGGEIDREIRFTSWESDDGTSYRFAARVLSRAGREDTRVKGRLTVKQNGGAGTAHYTVPEGKKVELPEGTYLPVGHLRKLLAEARKGSRQVRFYNL